jgi:hypothetical protein
MASYIVRKPVILQRLDILVCNLSGQFEPFEPFGYSGGTYDICRDLPRSAAATVQQRWFLTYRTNIADGVQAGIAETELACSRSSLPASPSSS